MMRAVNGHSNLCDVEYDRIKIDDKKYKSILFTIGGKDVWLPRSLIEVDEDAETVTLPEWKALDEGLI